MSKKKKEAKTPTHYYYTGLDTDLKCKFKNCQEKGGLVLSTYLADYSCEYCGRMQRMTLSSYYQPILKLKGNKHDGSQEVK